MPVGKLIFNPFAGRYPPEMLADQAAGCLRELGWQIEVEPTRSGAHITELAVQAAAAGLDALFVAGGDGSVGRAISGLAGSQTALGVLPAGTANVFAREMGLPRHQMLDPAALRRSARMLTNGSTMAVDIGWCNGIAFLLWAAVGLDARVVQAMEKRRRRRSRWLAYLAYGLLSVSFLIRWPGQQMSIRSWRDGSEQTIQQGIFWSGIATNIRHYAGGVIQFPRRGAGMDDGLFEFWLLRGQKMDRVRLLWNLWMQHDVDITNLQFLGFDRMQIEFSEPSPFHTDGEPGPAATSLELVVRPRALKVLAPIRD